VEMVVTPSMNVVRGGALIRFATNVGCGLSRVLKGRKLNKSLGLPTTTIGIVETPRMVFTNLIMNTHVNKIVDEPSMSLITIGGYKGIDVENPKEGY